MPNSCEIIYAGWRREMMGQRRLRRRRRRSRWYHSDDDDDDDVTPASSKASSGGGEDGNSSDAAPIFFVFCVLPSSMLLPAEGASFGESGPAAGGLAEDRGAAGTNDHRLGVAEHRRDLVASGTLDVHEVRVGTLYQPLQFAFPLLLFDGWVEKIFRERHDDCCSCSCC